MNLTPDQLRQNAAAMIAYAEGKDIQFQDSNGTGNWTTHTNIHNPDWDFKNWNFRPKPEPKTRAWNDPEDVPGPICYIRKEDGVARLITSIHTTGLLCDGGHILWHQIKDSLMQHSTDRKNWFPCAGREEEK